MKYANTYRIEFWGDTPDLYLTIEKPVTGKPDSMSVIESIAIHTVNSIAGRAQVTEGAIKSIDVLSAFGSVIWERGDL